MKKTLFINGYIYLPGESAIKRTFYLFDMMREQGLNVTFLTSDFNHYNKRVRDVNAFYSQHSEYRHCVKFLPMIPYEKNISVKRYLSGNAFEHAAVQWFKNNGKDYDVVYITLPASYIAREIRKYCDKFGTKMVIDVNDLWPESLRLVIRNEFLYNLSTYFIRKNVKKGYSNADGIVAVSNEYLKLASDVNDRATKRISVYIGAMLDKFDTGVEQYSKTIEKPNDEFWLTYVGTLGKSYDIDTVIGAVEKINREKHLKVRFKILGHGPTEAELKEFSKRIGTDAIDFMGFLDYQKMAAYLSKSDVCMNCIKPKASQSIINKISDYFSSGHPVLNCGPCKEMKELIDVYKTGINYESENIDSLCDAIMLIYGNTSLAAEMGRNARRLAELKFDRRASHQEIINLIETI